MSISKTTLNAIIFWVRALLNGRSLTLTMNGGGPPLQLAKGTHASFPKHFQVSLITVDSGFQIKFHNDSKVTVNTKRFFGTITGTMLAIEFGPGAINFNIDDHPDVSIKAR